MKLQWVGSQVENSDADTVYAISQILMVTNAESDYNAYKTCLCIVNKWRVDVRDKLDTSGQTGEVG